MVQRNFVVFTASAFLFLTAFSASSLIASQENSNKPPFKSSSPQSEINHPASVESDHSNSQSAICNLSSTSFGEPQLDKAAFVQKTKKLQIPFIANNGQIDEQVRFYANTFGGTVFVTKYGEIVYALPDVETQCLASSMHSSKGIRDAVGMLQDDHVSDIMHPASWIIDHDKSEFQNPKSAICNPKSKTRSVAIKETLVGGRVQEITGNEKAGTKVSYFKGKDPSKWNADISTYETVSLGEVYDGIELKLKAYGSNVEKLFCVKPGADPQQIKVRLSGIQPSGNPPPESPSVRGTGSCPPLAGAGGGLGARGLWVNEHGELEVETELVPVKFTKPVAYQEIDGKRVEIECGYVIADCGIQDEAGSLRQEVRSQKQEAESRKQETGLIGKRLIGNREKGMGRRGAYLASNSQLSTENLQPETQNPSPDTRHQTSSPTYSFIVASYDRTKDLIIDPLLASTYLGGSGSEYSDGYSIAIDTSGNVYVMGATESSNFPTTSGVYDTSYSNGDVFISKLDGGLTTLLASTHLGGSGLDYGYSLALDKSGNVYVTGATLSSNFPTTIGAYDTSFNNSPSYSDVFISKLNSGLTSLLASTYLGGSDSDWCYSLAIDISGNVYVTGYTQSTAFPTTSGAYDTTQNGSGDRDVFVSKLNSGLTSLLASTYLGGSDSDYGYSLTFDTSENVYVTGETYSTDFPTTSGVYDTSNSGGTGDVFVSKLNSGLTSLLASTYLGGSGNDYGLSLAIDTSGNIYVTGYTESTDFPTTSGAYDTSFNGGDSDIFVSKLDGGLTSLLASTYLGGYNYDRGNSLTHDTSGNVYVTGYTQSTDFPTTSGAYDTSYNSYYNTVDVFVSKLDGGLTSLLASTYLGGSGYDYGCFLALDTSGNVYVMGRTYSSDFPTTSGAYDTSHNGGWDDFVSKLDGNLSASPPTVTTGNATSISFTSATLNGTVNANGQSTTVWFQYDTVSGSYTNTSSTQTVTGASDTTVSISISGLSLGTTYYYRIVAQNSTGTVYGSEMSFTTLSDTEAPTGSININSNATYTNSSTVTLSLSATDNLGVTGYYLSTSSSTPSASDTGWTSATSTNSYSSNVSYTLSSGDGNKTVYIWFKDNSGNVSNSARGSIILDTTAPVITITSPTSNTTYTVTSSVIAIGGTASDSTSGVSSVTWSNDKGGSGTASGTTSWLTSSISLLSGDNVITVTAKDGTGNSGTDTLQVTYNPSGTVTAPSASTGSATNVTSSMATLNGTVNANGASTTIWFQYGTVSGSYGNTSSSQVVSGSSNTTVSISISGLSSNTSYYYRIVASNSAGTSYGSEASFATKTVSTTPTPTTLPVPTLSPVPTPLVSPTPKPTITPVASPSPAPTLPPLPTPSPLLSPTPIQTPTVEPGKKGSISGYVIDRRGNPIESAKIRLKAVNTEVLRKTISDEDGFFEIEDLNAGTYVVIARKMGYKIRRKPVKLKDSEDIEIEIKMKKQ